MIIFEKKINMLSEQEQIRREKLNKLKELGINPFPAALFPINTNSSEIISNYEENKKVTIAGRLMSRRIQGKASFAEIQDSKGKIQVYFNRDEICQGDDKTIYNEVYFKNLNTTLQADKVEVDLISKNSKIFMNNNSKKVKIINQE